MLGVDLAGLSGVGDGNSFLPLAHAPGIKGAALKMFLYYVLFTRMERAKGWDVYTNSF